MKSVRVFTFAVAVTALILAVISLCAVAAHAAPVQPAVTLTVTPTNPQPGQAVTITATITGTPKQTTMPFSSVASVTYTDTVTNPDGTTTDVQMTVNSEPCTINIVTGTIEKGAVRNPSLKVTIPTNWILNVNPTFTNWDTPSMQIAPSAGYCLFTGSQIPEGTTGSVTWKMFIPLPSGPTGGGSGPALQSPTAQSPAVQQLRPQASVYGPPATMGGR